MTQLFMQTLKSISGKFGFDPLSNTPTFSLELGDIDRPEYTLDEIFVYLAKADKPCIIAIDEFQQIAKYPEKNIEALLRTHIQKISNCHFIFAGSERHMMQNMFVSASRPFYHSADILELSAIPDEKYIPFIVGNFNKFGTTPYSGRSFPIYRNVRKKCCTPLQKTEKPARSPLPLLLNAIG